MGSTLREVWETAARDHVITPEEFGEILANVKGGGGADDERATAKQMFADAKSYLEKAHEKEWRSSFAANTGPWSERSRLLEENKKDADAFLEAFDFFDRTRDLYFRVATGTECKVGVSFDDYQDALDCQKHIMSSGKENHINAEGWFSKGYRIVSGLPDGCKSEAKYTGCYADNKARAEECVLALEATHPWPRFAHDIIRPDTLWNGVRSLFCRKEYEVLPEGGQD